VYAEARSRLIDGLPNGAGLLPAALTASILGAVAAYSPKTAIEALLAGAFFAVSVWRLELGIAAFMVLTFPEHLPGSFGAGATLAKPVGVLILLAWLVVVVRRGPARLLPRERPALFWTIVAFLLLGGMSVLWATDRGQAVYELGRLVQVAVLLVVAYTATSTHSGFRTAVWGYLLASVVTSLYAMASGAYAATGRLAGIFDPNYFAAELIPAVLMAAFLFVTTRSRRTRWLAAAAACIDLAAFVLTQSRGGIVGLTVALLAALALAGRARPRVLALVLVLVAGGLGYYLGYRPAHVFESFAGGVSGASSGRSDEWKIAIHMLTGHPLEGVGLGNFSVVEPSYATHTMNLEFVRYDVHDHLAAHSSYLEVAAELGVVGILLFASVLFLPLRLAGRALRALERRLDPLEFHVRGLIAGALGMFTSYVFLSAEWEKQLWLVLALLAAASALPRDEDEADQRKRNAR
jgi:O-antigen ligase